MKYLSTVSAVALFASFALPAQADSLLSGTIKNKDGAAMAGVTVSAKMDGSPMTTTVFTDQTGRYYFPDMPDGKYRVWAQAIAYDTGKSDVALNGTKSQDFTLQSFADFVKQLPGDEFLAALPEATADDARMKTFIRKTCTGCHTAAYPLQHKFDEAGWNSILEAMKRFNVLGVYRGDHEAGNPSIAGHQEELSRYLARARGPGDSSMNYNLRTRPTGEAARAVFKEYDVPLDPDLKLPGTYFTNDGSDWTKGTPSGMFGGYGVHDAEADLDGNIWFTHSWPSRTITVGRIDAKTGAFKAIKIDEPNGFASQTHGIVRDQKGFIWFNTRPGSSPGGNPTGLAKLDPKTEQVKVYSPPKPMSGTAGTLDVDPKGFIWVTSPDGVLRFDPEKETFLEFKSLTYKTEKGVGTVYGTAADSAGNGWWLDMKFDKVLRGDPVNGQTGEIQLPPVQAEIDRLTADEKALYAKYVVPDFNTPYPWAQGARRMGGDKNPDGEFVYVGNSFGGNLARINIKSNKVDLIPLPNPATQQPYQVAVDQRHQVWTNLWSTDAIAKYDPANSQWTLFDLPSRGTETRHISLLEKDGKLQVVLPYSRTRRVAVMTVRSEDDMKALAARTAR
jgi:streptogramin lyase